MPAHRQIKTVGYSPDQMFDLVLDVQSYPEFLPWCLSSSIINIKSTSFEAELLIGFGGSLMSGSDSALIYDTLLEENNKKAYSKQPNGLP